MEQQLFSPSERPGGEPMRRYTFPIRSPAPSCRAESGNAVGTRILEALLEQTQLLVDLTSAVNALTVAVLNDRRRT